MNSTAGEMIRDARKQAGLTQKQLSEKYEIPLSSLKDWELGLHKCPAYVATLLLRCMTIDFTTVQEQVTKQPEPTYSFFDAYGKPLSAELEKIARDEFETGKVELQEKHEQDFYGESIPSKSKRGWKLYRCTNSDYNPEREIPMGFEFRVIKEV